jgi:hypothetical protein
MDLYLPAEFHELHDAASDDWRDASSSRTRCERATALDSPAQHEPGDKEACADPLWRVI